VCVCLLSTIRYADVYIYIYTRAAMFCKMSFLSRLTLILFYTLPRELVLFFLPADCCSRIIFFS
jgi:hypothetical protein